MINELIECVRICNDNGNIKCKILTNGNLFIQDNFNELDKFTECYGYSINTQDDINNAYSNMNKIPFDKTTMVTNFGIHNIELFDKLWKFAINFKYWQVQLTIGNELQLDIEDIKLLLTKINNVPKQKQIVKIIIADNMNCSDCRAGRSGCAVTWNGDVVPCLSYRAWCNDMHVQGNVFKDSLKNIWKTKFGFYRNRQFIPCCKSISGIDLINKKLNELDKLNELTKHINKDNQTDEQTYKQPPVFVYGVISPKDNFGLVVYGVFGDSDIYHK